MPRPLGVRDLLLIYLCFLYAKQGLTRLKNVLACRWGEKMPGPRARRWAPWLLVPGLTLTTQTGGPYALAQESPPATSWSEEASIQPQGVVGAILGGLTGAIGAALTYTADAAWDGGRHANARDFAAAVI